MAKQEKGGAYNEETVQDPEDKQAPGYDNIVAKDWRRGYPTAEGKPGFDHGGGAKGK